MTTLLDALAAYALACYYCDAQVPENERHDDDAHGLLNACPSWVVVKENEGYSMANTRAAVINYTALATDYIGFAPLDIVAIYSEVAEWLPCQRAAIAVIVERERDTWQAICQRTGEDGEVLAAYDELLEELTA